MAYKPYYKNSAGTLVELPLVANQVGTNTVGTSNKPVYISNGVPVACSDNVPTASEMASLSSNITTLQDKITALENTIAGMLNGTVVFTYLKANIVDLVDSSSSSGSGSSGNNTATY